MNSKIKFILLVLLALKFISCANIIPPSGGAKDTLAPVLIQAIPKDSSIFFKAQKITLTFNEFVEAKEIQQNLVVNPLLKNMPVVDYKLQNVFVVIKDSLEPNTTYTINFGNAIRDVNEGNLAKNKTFVFSTGNTIDYRKIEGNVVLAQDGKIDSTLIVVLHNNLSDSSVKKNKPKYLSKLDGKGNFAFTNLPKGNFNIYALPNDYSKIYDDTTKLFAFLNNPIHTDSTKKIQLLAYKQAEEKKTSLNKSNSNIASEEALKYTLNILGNKFDILDSALTVTFNKQVSIDSLQKIVLTDTNYNPLKTTTYFFDSINKSIIIKNSFGLNETYCLIIHKSLIKSNKQSSLTKTDTIKFSTLSAKDYGSIKMRTKSNTSNIVVQVINANNVIIDAMPFSSKEIKKTIFKPGEYELRILFDENNNNTWDAGNYSQKIQPEKVIALKTKLVVKPNWDNEIEIDW